MADEVIGPPPADAPPPPPTVGSSDVQPKRKRRFKLWHKILAAVVVLIVVLVIVINSATSGATKASNLFLEHVQKGNTDAAYALFSTEAQAVVQQDSFRQLVSQVSPILTGKPKMVSKEVSGGTGRAATGVVIYEIRGSDGKTYRITVNLVKQSGDWMIQSFESKAKE